MSGIKVFFSKRVSMGRSAHAWAQGSFGLSPLWRWLLFSSEWPDLPHWVENSLNSLKGTCCINVRESYFQSGFVVLLAEALEGTDIRRNVTLLKMADDAKVKKKWLTRRKVHANISPRGKRITYNGCNIQKELAHMVSDASILKALKP